MRNKMRNKKGLIYLISPLLMISSPCWAMCEGFYGGIGLGVEALTLKQHATIARDGSFAVYDKQNRAGRGFAASIYAGYDFSLCGVNPNLVNLWLGLELNANISTLKSRTNNFELFHSNFNVSSYRMGHNLWLNFLPGYAISDCTQLYVPLGFGIRQFSISTAEVTIPNINRTLPGIRYGLGIKQYLNDCFSLRFEYAFSTYRKTVLIGSDPVSGVGKVTTFIPQSSIFQLGGTYHF
jgi:opacity protein-like surface antigen